MQERPDPPVGAGQVRIAVRAAGINFADTMARVGLYPDAPKPPCVLGYEVAGEIESVGEGVSEAQGRGPRRRRHPLRRPGGAGHGPGRAGAAALARLSFEQGAAFPVNYGTAYAALVLMGGLREGDRVLDPRRRRGGRHRRHPDRRNAGAEIFGTASPGQARGDSRPGRGAPDRLPHPGLRGRGQADDRRRGRRPRDRRARPGDFRKDYRLLRAGGRLVMFGLSEATSEGRRDMRAALRSLVKMPPATCPGGRA